MARKQHVNRENKLAIIIGFSLVLVVAVLISDHFSRASSAEISAEIKPGTADDFGAGAAGLTEPIGGPSAIPAHAGPLSGELTDSRTRTVSTTGDGEHRPEDFVMGPGNGEGSYIEPPEQSDTGEYDDARPEIPGVPAKPMSVGKLRTHEVKDGDKLYRIAERYYNDGTLWKALAEYNKERVPNASSLRVGVTLRIPPKDVLLGEAVLAPEGVTPRGTPARESTGGRPSNAKPADKPKSSPADRAVAKNQKAPVKTYKVARGDSLGTIAQKLLGSSRRASELYQLNKDVLEDEHSVVAGMVIKIPAR